MIFSMLGMFGGDRGYASQLASEAEGTAARSGRKAEKVGNDLRRLEDKISRLTLINMAVWELLKKRTNLTEDDLMDKVREIDLRDGVADGKISKANTLAKCPNCGRTMSDRHARCLYCGQANLEAVAWDGVI